jgi:segregation and condensation protein A
LLLFLIRRDEIDIYDIPIARITQQYLQYVDLLNQLDPEIVSEFLVLAATLMEIKSRMLLPHPPQEQLDEEIVDPRLELVRQLLEYKTYKDAARSLEEAAAERALRHERRPTLPESKADEIAIENLDIWDLFEAFNRLLTQIGKAGGVHQVGVDDTPVALHAEDILDSIQRAGGTETFEEIFTGRSRAEMIGLFLALLELIRQRRIRAIQDRPFGPILIRLLDPTPLDRVDDVPDEPRDQSAMPAPFAHAVASDIAGESDETDSLLAMDADEDDAFDSSSVPAAMDVASRIDPEIDSTEFVDAPE